MAGIKDIIKIFHTSEVKKVIEYITNNSSKKELKIIDLFNLLYKNNLSNEEIIVKLYGAKNRNAYYSLTKRLTKLLVDYISSSELSEEDKILTEYNRYLLAGKKLLRYKIYNNGFKLLRKAEKIALEEENYIFLNEIHLIFIEYNHYNKSCLLANQIEKFEKNWILYNQEISLQLSYAQVKNEISLFLIVYP